MHNNALILQGAEHNELFSGVIWRDSDAANMYMLRNKIQEMLDACHSLIEGHTGGDADQTAKVLDGLIHNWQQTGLVYEENDDDC